MEKVLSGSPLSQRVVVVSGNSIDVRQQILNSIEPEFHFLSELLPESDNEFK